MPTSNASPSPPSPATRCNAASHAPTRLPHRWSPAPAPWWRAVATRIERGRRATSRSMPRRLALLGQLVYRAGEVARCRRELLGIALGPLDRLAHRVDESLGFLFHRGKRWFLAAQP